MSTKHVRMKPAFGWATVSPSGQMTAVAEYKSEIGRLSEEKWQRVRITAYTPPNQKKSPKKGGSK